MAERRAPLRNLLAGILVVLLLALGAQAVAVEEPKYDVVRSYPEFELRSYAPQILAETRVTGDFDEVGDQAFRILADYIFGNNQSRTKLDMTAPVSQRSAEGGEIPMAAPVTQRADLARDGDNSYVLAFVMPSGYSLDTLPTPNDPRVQLREEAAQVMAVRRYSGRWTRSRYEENLQVLLEGLREAGLEPTGDPTYARYNPPFTPWFLRRNEVMIPIEDRAR